MPSKTLVDLPKVAQLLDAGWSVMLFKNGLKTYTAIGRHDPEHMAKCGALLDEDGEVTTDDFTPEQALTRLAYKVFGEIL